MNEMIRGLMWVVCVLWASVASGADAGDAPAVFEVAQVEEIRAALGEVVTVRGVVERTGKSKGSGMNFLNFPGGEFTVVVYAKSLKRFPDGEPADIFEGKLIEVRGEVVLYNEKLQIVVEKPDQIVMLDPATKKPFPVAEEEPEPAPKDPQPEEVKVAPVAPDPGEGKVDPRRYFDDPQ